MSYHQFTLSISVLAGVLSNDWNPPSESRFKKYFLRLLSSTRRNMQGKYFTRSAFHTPTTPFQCRVKKNNSSWNVSQANRQWRFICTCLRPHNLASEQLMLSWLDRCHFSPILLQWDVETIRTGIAFNARWHSEPLHTLASLPLYF